MKYGICNENIEEEIVVEKVDPIKVLLLARQIEYYINK